MAPGAPSPEGNRVARVGGTSPHARENAPDGAQGQEPLHGKQQLPPGPGEEARETGMDAFAFGCKHNIADVIGPEKEPPDAQNLEEDSGSPVETERCPEPRTAKSRKRTRRTRGSEGGAHVAGRGPMRRLFWRTRPKPARARHKAIESWKLDA